MEIHPFFDESTGQSEVKAAIVSKYFWAWANVIKGQCIKNGCNMAYIDLFAGPGRYKDGAKSTPLLILEKAVQDKDLRKILVTLFNDVDSDHSKSLEEEIKKIPDIEKLKHAPIVDNEEVGSEIVEYFEEMNLVPTLFFVDPWGYKGLSLRLINSVLKNWGCDCIFFFNYNRINMGLGNESVKEHIDSLFGEEKASELRKRINKLKPKDRELAIVESLCEALVEMGGKYTLPFTFVRKGGRKTSHHLIFVSKHHRGYEIMKEIMAKESSSDSQGVPSFQYNPAIKKMGLLFDLSRSLDELENMLMKEFRGKIITMKEIYENHHVGKRFIKKNYKKALQVLEENGNIEAEPDINNRRNNTFADHVQVTFPD